MENEELQEFLDAVSLADLRVTLEGSILTLAIIDEDGVVLVNDNEGVLNLETEVYAHDIDDEFYSGSIWEYPTIDSGEEVSVSFDLSGDAIPSGLAAVLDSVGFISELRACFYFNSYHVPGEPSDTAVSLYDYYWDSYYSYVFNGMLTNEDNIKKEYSEILSAAIVTDNTEYPEFICHGSTMQVPVDISIDYSPEDLIYGDVTFHYSGSAYYGSSVHITAKLKKQYYFGLLSSISIPVSILEIPQPEIVSDDLTVDVEILSPASFQEYPNSFHDNDFVIPIGHGTGSADLTISGGLAPYEYSISLGEYFASKAKLEGHTNVVSDDGVVELRGVVGSENGKDNDDDGYYDSYNFLPYYLISVTDANGCTLYKYFDIPYRYEERPSLSSTKLINEIYLDGYTDGLSNGSVSVTANTEAPAVLEFKKESDSEWKTLHTFQLGNEDEVSFTEEGLDAGTYEFRISLTAEEDQGYYSISSQVEVIKSGPSNSCQLLIDYIMNEQIAILQARLDAVEARADQSGRIVESNNFALGEGTLENADSTTDYNFAFGRNTLHNLEGGDKNISIGNRSQYNNVTGNDNISIGNGALDNVVDGEGNIAIGKNAGNWGGNSSNKLSIGTGAPLIGGDFKTREITLDGKTLSFLSTPSGVQFVAWE